MFEYNIYAENSVEKFKEACVRIETAFPQAIKKKLLVDVDGSLIQIFILEEKEIIVYDDYDIGAVFVESEVDLSNLFT